MNSNRNGSTLMAMAVVMAMLVLACSSSPSSTSTPAAGTATPGATGATTPAPTGAETPAPSSAVTPEPTATPEPTPISTFDPGIPRDQPGPNGGTVVRWFIGLGAGTQPSQIEAEKAFVEAYNASQSDVFLQIEIIPNTTAADVLKTELQSPASAPDIIGPVGVEGLNLFSDQLFDMAPIIETTGYTSTGVDPALVDFFNSLGQNGATVGLPFAVYPSFIIYNKDLFDEAALPYLPTQVGEQYNGAPWDLDALRTLAMKLTVDAAGNDATSAEFDPENIVQWGFDSQYMDNYNLRAETAWFGTGPLLADDGTAQIPAAMAAGAKWWNDGVWTDHFIPTASQVASDLLLAGSEFASGNLAIDEAHTWFTCCVTPPEGTAPFNFGFAVNPLVNGTITSPLHADTFSILKTTAVPDAAFKAITAMVESGDLLTAYGAMPADQTKQQAWFDSVDASFPGIELDWSVAQQMLAYPDIPNHQSYVPDYAAVRSAMQAFGNKYRTTPGLDIDAELAALQVTLQGIFDAAQ